MIRIETHDLNKGDRAMLLALSAAFATVANGELPDAATIVVPRTEITTHVHGATSDAIDSDDNPSTGSPDAVEVFSKGDTTMPMPPAALVFGQSPNAPAAPSQTASVTGNAAATAQNTNHAPAQNGAIELDADGLPWDGRIHSSNKTRNQDGRWKKRKGVTERDVVNVEAELRAAMGNAPVAGSPVAPVPAAPIATIPVPPPVAPVEAGNVPTPPNPPTTTIAQTAATSAVPAAPVPTVTADSPNVQSAPPAPPTVGLASSTVSPSVPVGETQVNAQSAAPSMSFAHLCGAITRGISSGTLTQDMVAGVLAANGLAGLPTLAALPHKVPEIAQQLGLA